MLKPHLYFMSLIVKNKSFLTWKGLDCIPADESLINIYPIQDTLLSSYQTKELLSSLLANRHIEVIEDYFVDSSKCINLSKGFDTRLLNPNIKWHFILYNKSDFFVPECLGYYILNYFEKLFGFDCTNIIKGSLESLVLLTHSIWVISKLVSWKKLSPQSASIYRLSFLLNLDSNTFNKNHEFLSNFYSSESLDKCRKIIDHNNPFVIDMLNNIRYHEDVFIKKNKDVEEPVYTLSCFKI